MDFWCIDKSNNKSQFISNNSFNELYGIDEENSGTLVKKEKLDESKYGVIRIPTLLDKKSERDFADLRMVQDFAAHKEAIWVAEFSPT